MHHFIHKNNEMYCEEVRVADIAAAVGTPFYLYSEATLARHFETFDSSFAAVPHRTCFAVKACSNLAILRLFAGLGSGADIVSGGELYRALKAGIDPKRIIYSGVGKTAEEMRYALESAILMFNVESVQELERLEKVAAELEVRAPVAFRINPDVDPQTHAYISTGLAKNKFGIPIEQGLEAYRLARSMDHIDIVGVSCHIGSQLTTIAPFVDSLIKLKGFVARLRAEGVEVKFLDLGGGLGITYADEQAPPPREYARAIEREMAGLDCTLILEPGRVIVGNAAILVTRVQYTKQGKKKFVIVDAGMNDLARPSLYGAYHAIQAVSGHPRPTETADLVGPICETGDFLARDQEIPVFEPGDLVAVMSAGAYGFSMSSNYNSRPRVPEVLVKGEAFYVIRERENFTCLTQGETIPDFLS